MLQRRGLERFKDFHQVMKILGGRGVGDDALTISLVTFSFEKYPRC